MSIILCTNNYNFNAKYERKTSTCPITSACPITKPKVYKVFLLLGIVNEYYIYLLFFMNIIKITAR
jgi:hypothetical protein